MPLTFQIFPQRGLVYIRYTGYLRLADTVQAFAEYARHPDCAPGQKQLVDLAGVTGYERDFTELMKVQAQKAETFTGGRSETLLVYYAPTEMTLELAHTIDKSWTDVPGVVISIQSTEDGALAILGQKEETLADLLQQQL